jgi:hypothetical protein
LTNPQEQAQRDEQSLLQSRADRQALMARTFANPERPFQVTDQAGLAQLGTDVLTGELGIAPIGMIAYHGTPHNILGQFDINKVGTGEGAQAYGYGMYFAEAPDVAKSYATDRSYVGKFMAGTPDTTPWGAKRIAQDTLNVHGDNAISQLEKTLKNNSSSKNPQQIEANKQVQEAIDLLKSNQLTPTGNLYKVDIPDEYIPKMLDYDKPLKEQTNILEGLLSKKSGFTGQTKQEIQELVKKGANGEDLIDLFGQNQKELSDELSKLGIKGIRYLDEGSRNQAVQPYYQLIRKSDNAVYTQMQDLKKAEEFVKDAKSKGVDFEISAPVDKRTSNFVVFDPTDVKILERNNQPIEGLLD